MKTSYFASILALVALTAFGCSGDGLPVADVSAAGQPGAAGQDSGIDGGGGAPSAEAFELIGNWIDNFDSPQIIDAATWNSSTIIEYDNAANVVYAQYPADDEYSPNKFSKTVYTDPKDDSFYFCTIVFSADSLEDAKSDTAVADDTDPENSGCGQFSWSFATKQQ
jgi:hypothetical protein